jgi:peptidylprolyl isomerase
MRPRLALAGLAVLLCSGQAPAPDTVVAQSGANTITVAGLHQLLDSLNPEQRRQAEADPAALTTVIRTQLVQLTLLAEAKAKKFDQTPAVAARAEQARQSAIVQSYVASLTDPPADYPTEAEIQAAYDANKARLLVPRQYELAQIVVLVPAGAAHAQDDEAQKKIRDIRAQAARPGAESFADLARKLSEDQATAKDGGSLRWMREDILLPPVRDAVSGLQENALSEPVRISDGWHLFKLLGTKPAGTPALAEVRDQIARALRQQRATENERALIDALLRRQPVRVDEIRLQQVLAK